MRRSFSILLVMASGPAFSQTTTPSTPDPDPIIVTGERDNARVGLVNYELVWRRCAECLRALDQIKLLSRPYHVKKDQIARDQAATAVAVGLHFSKGKPGSVEDRIATIRSNNLQGLAPSIPREDREELAMLRADAMKLINTFLQQLEPHARAAVKMEQEALELAAVYNHNARKRPQNVRNVEITNAVIQRLNAMEFEIVLPDPPTPAK